MSYGVPFVTPLPTPGVTQSPTFESQLIARDQEVQAKLEAKIADADIALTGGDIAKHGIRATELAAADFLPVGATYDPANLYHQAAGAGNTASHGIPVQPGQRIRSVTCHGRNSGVAWTWALLKIAKATGIVTPIASQSSTTVPAQIDPVTLTVSEVALAGFAYVMRWTAGGAGDRILGAEHEVDRP